MKEQMEVMMNALKGRVSSDLDDLVNRTDSPFTAPVNSCPLPPKFRMPQVESYDGIKDPLDHLETFKTMMHLQGVPVSGRRVHQSVYPREWIAVFRARPVKVREVNAHSPLSAALSHRRRQLMMPKCSPVRCTILVLE